jgi:glycosyltransferase involved in cell wall biosynthesis
MDLDFPTTTRQPAKDNRLRIGFIGTLSRYKGADLLIRAVLAAPKMLAEVKIFGDLSAYPDYAEELQTLAANDQRIRFMGTFANAVIGRIFAEIDLLVVPSIWYENTPLVIYSAQACGCPVLASDIGGISEVVKDGENGLLFAAGQVKEITSALLGLSEDRSLLAKLAGQTRKPRSISDYVLELLSEYESALNK